MSVGAELDAFQSLGQALGILDAQGDPNDQWFQDPVGQAGNPNGLQDILSDDRQRDALLAFADDVLGAPDRTTRDGATWVPLFSEQSPKITIFAVIKPVAGAVNIGIGFEHSMNASAPSVSTRVHVPLFRAQRGGTPLSNSGSVPPWLLLGRPDGRIDITLDLALRDGAPAAGEPSLGGLGVILGIPTDGSPNLRIALELRDLQLPGAAAPRTLALDAATPGALGAEVLELVATLIRAQVDAVGALLPTEVGGLLGLLGLRAVPGLPPLPLADLPTRGLDAIVEWIRAVFNTAAARSAWFNQLRAIIGGSVDIGAQSVSVTSGALRFTVGVRPSTGTGGALVITPWVEISLGTVTGARARILVDVLRADLTTGAITAIPDLRAEAVFGTEAGGTALLTGNPGVGGLRAGLVLTADRRPAFAMTLHDVTIGARSFALLDISSPDAAVTAIDSVVSSALDAAMTGFGVAGDLIGKLLGIRAPAGVTGVSSSALLSDPLAELTRYWRDLAGAPAAMSDVLGALRALIAQVPHVNAPGLGTRATPWRVQLAGPLVLLVWRDGGTLVVDAALDVVTPAFGDHTVTTTLRASLMRLTFAPVQVTFVGVISASVELTRAGQPLELDIGALFLSATSLRAMVSWSPAAGLAVDLSAPGARAGIELPQEVLDVAIPLPVRGADGRYTLPATVWPDVQSVVTALAMNARVPVVQELLRVIGWHGGGVQLPLASLVTGDPALAIRRWLADLLLDCDRARAAMNVVATILSGGTRRTALGTGGVRLPYRCPVGGAAAAPSLAAWLIPPCAPRVDFGKQGAGWRAFDDGEEGGTLAARLRRAGEQLPDVRDLMTGRDSLDLGIEQLVTRWLETDGVVVVPASLPTDVTMHRMTGSSYDDLVADGATGLLASRFFAAPPATVIHVGADEAWRTDRPAGRAVDATGTTAIGAIAPTGTGEWFVMLPSALAARALRPDGDAVAEQAERLARVLAGRTAPVTIIAYGACGAAAIRAAATRTVIESVVTIGTPWTPVSVSAFRSGLSADALRVLQRQIRADAPTLSPLQRALSATPLDVMRDLIARTLTVASDDGALPSAGAEARRTGLVCQAVFGELTEDVVRTGIALLIDDGIALRFERARDAAVPSVPRSALHVGVDIPVIVANVGGVRVGLGATFDLAALVRDAAAGVRISTDRSVTLHVELAVTDGWLVGGPSAEPGDVDVRWMSANITIPFDASAAGDTELVLYEATGLGAFRERWVVRADADGVTATVALPEVRAVLSAVAARLRTASPALASLLDVIGVVREGGLDATGLDRLLFEQHLVAAQVRTRAAEVATALRTLMPGISGAGSALAWTVEGATLALDVGARTLSATVATELGGAVPIAISAQLRADGTATAEFSLGNFDANAGGVRLIGRAGAVHSLGVEWGAAGGAAPRVMSLLPVANLSALGDFAAMMLPAYLLHGLASSLRDRADAAGRAAIDAALDAVSLLHAADPDGRRAIKVPLALFDDAAAWLLRGGEAWRTDPIGSTVRLLDAVVPIVAPARGAATGWPIVSGVSVNYAGVGGRLVLTLNGALNATVGTAAVATRILAGVSIAADGRAEPTLDLGVTIDGTGLQLAVAPDVQLSLVRPAPAPLLPIYPAGAGLASVLSAVGETVLPPVLNALAARRTSGPASLEKDVGAAVFDIGGALDLRDGTNFTAARLATFAADPASRLLARMPQLIGLGTATLARALDPGATVVRVIGPTAGRVTLQFGSAQQIGVELDTSGPTPVVRFSGTLAVPAIGNIVIEELRLAASGVAIGVRLGPAAVQIDGVTLRPVLALRAGVGTAGFTRFAGLGFALNDTGSRSVELRWALNETPPSLAVVTRAASETLDTDPARVALSILSVAASVASGVALKTLIPRAPAPPVLPPEAVQMLEKVLLVTSPATGTQLDPTLFDDLLDPDRLFRRLKRLLWNLATATTPLSVTIDGKVKIGFASDAVAGGRMRLGVKLGLVGTEGLALTQGDPIVSLVADESMIGGPAGSAGISIMVFEGQLVGDDIQLDVEPSLLIDGVGLRFKNSAGPMISLGPIALDGIKVLVFGEISSSGVGAGVLLELTGLAIAPSGGSGNPVAGGILADAGRGGQNNRPAFSPAISVVQRAGASLGVSVRAGPPPGPWFLRVQRELGPLYLEQLGFDARAEDGSITRLQLIFDGRVSIFGMVAAVDQLSLTWNGGDVFDVTRWTADLDGLAVSADFGGVVLAGGLLKDSSGGYLGMLLGRFGTYGLTVYGGYAVLDGNPSFFIFGALNGPIGGPPAFFLTGIGAGLGINRQLRVPEDISQFGEYPFIKALDIAASVPDPMVELRKLNDYFRPQLGQFWIAGGISFTSFALVDGIAVLAVSFGSDGLDIYLLGLARMALPRPQVALVSIELALVIRFSTREGLFSIRAQLTENSWLLYPEVRLTGGFAFVVWWKGPLAGQFVLTIGGYHPRFHRDGYPDVPRVGLRWQVSNAIVIKGGSYFALTSEALMAGIEVTVSADFGWAWARIEFGANGIVYFDPFWFEVEAYATISAGVKIKTFLGTIRFSLSTSAGLLVHGPDFGGRARFKVGPASVTVPFGSDDKKLGPALEWDAFVAKYLETGTSGGARSLSAITGLGTLPRKPSEAKAESADGSAARPFEVYGEFQISIGSAIPITTVRLGPSNATRSLTPTKSDGARTPMTLGLSPMRHGNLRSTLTLSIVGTSAEVGVAGPKPGVLDGDVSMVGFDTEAFPVGVWGEPQADAQKPIPKGDVIIAMNRVRFDLRRSVGASAIPAIPFRRVETGRAVLPLQARGGLRGEIFDTAASVAVAKPPTVAAALTAAELRLFAPPVGAAPAGFLVRGDAGASARAAYRGDRVAPPLFGTLADGLQRTNASDGASKAAPPPKVVVPAKPRPPKMTALLAGGAGVIERGAMTSVSNKALKRRPAPSLDSVRMRLTRQLPTQLARVARAGVVNGGTLLAVGAAPFTAVPGVARSRAVGKHLSGSALGAVVGGLQSVGVGPGRAPESPEQLHAGDLVVLHAPDASSDVDTTLRPSLSLTGKARITMTASDGTVLGDVTADKFVVIPPRTALIGIQAAGDIAGADGLAGWHERTRIARFNRSVAVGPGCALTFDGVANDVLAAWCDAGDALADATAVTTRFASPVKTIVVVLAGRDEPDADDVVLDLVGASRVKEKSGALRSARVVMAGDRAAMLYDIVPLRGANVSVSVRIGGIWRLAGVLGGMVSSATLVRRIAERGVVAVAARLLVAADGKPITVTWIAPPVPPTRPAPGKPAASRTARNAKKTTTRRGTRNAR